MNKQLHQFFTNDHRRIETLLKKATEDPNEIKAGEYNAFRTGLVKHLKMEEQILFPYIVALAQAAEQKRTVPFAPFGTVNNPVRMMMMEHDTAGEILRDMRALTADYKVPADACISYQTLYQALENFEKDLHQHIHLENNILFPRALELENSLRQ